MPVPKSIKIGGAVYDVIYHKGVVPGTTYRGQINYNSGTIDCATDGDEQDRLNTLLHETFHGLIKFMNINDKTVSCEEDLVLRLTEGVLMVIKDNPALFKKIMTST